MHEQQLRACGPLVALQPAGESPPRPFWPPLPLATPAPSCRPQRQHLRTRRGRQVEGSSAARAGSSWASPSGRSAAMKLITAKRFSTFCCSRAL